MGHPPNGEAYLEVIRNAKVNGIATGVRRGHQARLRRGSLGVLAQRIDNAIKRKAKEKR